MFSYAIAATTLFTLVLSEIEYDDNYRYIAVWDDTKSVTWVEALQYCIEEMETVLGSIHNDSDQESVLLAARATGANVSSDSGLTSNDYVWIGLSDTDDEGNFTWVDGSALDYNNWQADEPKAPDCVNIINTEWYASTCSTAATTSVWVCNRPYGKLYSYVLVVFFFYFFAVVLFFLFVWLVMETKQKNQKTPKNKTKQNKTIMISPCSGSLYCRMDKKPPTCIFFMG